MDFFNSWIQGIIVSVVIATIIEMIIPNGNNKKYIKVILGIYIVFCIMAPIVNIITNNDFEISSVINIEKYKKQFETYDLNSRNNLLEKDNDKNIKNIYINNLKLDLKSKLKDKGYLLKDIEIEVENDDTYQIKKMTLKLDSNHLEKIENENENENENKKENIEEIEIKIDKIKINNNDNNSDSDSKSLNNNIQNNEDKISHNEKTELIKYISETYGINEKNIVIF